MVKKVLIHDRRTVADDIRNGVSFLRSLDQVDDANVFSVGICAGTGFAGLAAAFDSRIQAVAMISPFITTKHDFLEMFGGNAALIRERVLPAAAVAAQREFETGEPTYGNLVPVTEEEIKSARPIPLGMRDYYLEGKPGDVPTWKNRLNLHSYYYALSFSIFDFVDYFDGLPLFMAYGEDAASAAGAQKFFDLVQGEKQLLTLPGADHFEMYWKPEYVDPTVEGIDDFFSKHRSSSH